MLLCALLVFSQGPTSEALANLDRLAKARDLAGLSAYLAPYSGRNPMEPISWKEGAAYGTGKNGWRALLLRMLNESFVVFSTDLTAEDIGELLFRFDRNGKLVYVPEDFTNGERIASHDFHIRFDIPAKKAFIKDTIELQMVGRRTYPPMIRIGPNYRVSKITDAQGREVAFLQAGGIVCFPGLSSDEKLTLNYVGVVDKYQFAGSIRDNDILLSNDYWYPMVARQPAPYRLTATVPSGWTAVAQGNLVSQSTEGTAKVETYEMKVPASYFSFSAAPFQVYESMTNGKKYSVWTTAPNMKESAGLVNAMFPPIIEFYSRIVPYPFEGWGAVMTSAMGGSALEAYSYATYPGPWYEDPHETAHTWWGGLINNTYLHSLWNESFADFSEGFYRRNVPIGNQAERRLAFVETPNTPPDFKVAPLSTASPFIGPACSTIGYGKGAFVLQMLETEVGTDRLLKSMQEWQHVQPNTRGGEWEDFEQAVDRVPGNDERWFFDQWVNRAGWADFDVKDLKWVNNRLVGSVVFASEPYILHVEVLLRDEHGHDTFVKAILADNVREKEQHFVIACPTKPAVVSFDPWRRFLRPIQADESPVSLSSALRGAKRYNDPAHPEYLKGFERTAALDSLPSDLSGTFIVGNPGSLAAMRDLCARAGFQVDGSKLTWRGTEIDLKKGAAMAVVDLPGGKNCVIGLGQTLLPPLYGRAKTVLVDQYGRFLRGETLPKTSGHLTYRGF